MTWHHLPIVDVSMPEASFERAGSLRGRTCGPASPPDARFCCIVGVAWGRTGTIAAQLLVELGVPAEEAIVRVREARPGTIETGEQEAYVRRVRPRRAGDSKAAEHPKPAADVLDCARGALLGLAVGDALGTTIELSRATPIRSRPR